MPQVWFKRASLDLTAGLAAHYATWPWWRKQSSRIRMVPCINARDDSYLQPSIITHQLCELADPLRYSSEQSWTDRSNPRSQVPADAGGSITQNLHNILSCPSLVPKTLTHSLPALNAMLLCILWYPFGGGIAVCELYRAFSDMPAEAASTYQGLETWQAHQLCVQ